MNESSSTPDGGGHPFDVEQFARDTIRAIEFGDDCADVLQRQVVRIEEIVAARWPRRWLLLRRLRREIRASVAGYPEDVAPRRDFTARRLQYAGDVASVSYQRRHRRQDPGTGGRR